MGTIPAPYCDLPRSPRCTKQTRPCWRIPAGKVEQENVPADAQPAAYLSKDLRTPLPVTGSADLLCGSQTRRSADITRCWCKAFGGSSSVGCHFQEYRKIGGDPDCRAPATLVVECSAQISLKRIYCRDPSGFRGRRGQLILGFNGFVSFNQESAASLSVLQPFRWFPALGLPSWGFHPGSEPLHIRVDLRGSAVPPRPDWAWFYHLFVQNFWIDLCNPKKDPIRSENFCLV